MKHKFLILLLTILGLSFSSGKNRMNNFHKVADGKVLLIEYDQEIFTKIIKDYRKKKDRKSITEGLPYTGTNYDSFNKMLYVDENIQLTDSSKIVFWETNVMDISLPFRYSYITLDRFVNDSIVQITLNNKKYICSPGQDLFDTITSIETEGKRVTQSTTIFHVKNHGLIFRKNIITERERMRRIYEELRIRDSIDLNDLEKWEKKK